MSFIKCPECKCKFTFTERFKLATSNNLKIVCSRCKNTFEKDSNFNRFDFKMFDFAIGLFLKLTTITIFINLVNINIYLTVFLAVIFGQVVDYIYLFLIQNLRSYKKYIK